MKKLICCLLGHKEKEHHRECQRCGKGLYGMSKREAYLILVAYNKCRADKRNKFYFTAEEFTEALNVAIQVLNFEQLKK